MNLLGAAHPKGSDQYEAEGLRPTKLAELHWLHMHAYIHTYIHTYINMYIYIYIIIYLCVCALVYVYACRHVFVVHVCVYGCKHS